MDSASYSPSVKDLLLLRLTCGPVLPTYILLGAKKPWVHITLGPTLPLLTCSGPLAVWGPVHTCPVLVPSKHQSPILSFLQC